MATEAQGLTDEPLAEGEARALGAAIRSHVGRFFARAKQFVRELILAGTMALNGPSPLDANDLAEADRQARVQSQYFDRFEAEMSLNPPRELAEPSGLALTQPMTAAGFAARVESYGGSAWNTQNIIRRRWVRRPGVLERRIHTRTEPHAECATCIGESAKGWQPAGSLLELGDSICMTRCDCTFEFKAPGGKIYRLGDRIPA